jgi:hypothetical protein
MKVHEIQRHWFVPHKRQVFDYWFMFIEFYFTSSTIFHLFIWNVLLQYINDLNFNNLLCLFSFARRTALTVLKWWPLDLYQHIMHDNKLLYEKLNLCLPVCDYGKVCICPTLLWEHIPESLLCLYNQFLCQIGMVLKELEPLNTVQ